MIQSHIERNIFDRGVKGPDSPMQATEPLFVNVCIQDSKMRQPVNVTEDIEVVNSLILYTLWKNKLMEFQKRWKIDEYGENLAFWVKNTRQTL